VRLGIADNILWAIYLGLSMGLQWDWMFWAITGVNNYNKICTYV
jgi:hypothetical protein